MTQRGSIYQLTPTTAQAANFAQTIGACRWVYNGCLTIWKQVFTTTGKSPTFGMLGKWLTWNRAALPWLRALSVDAQQQAIRDLRDAYRRFFKGQNRRPGFKSRRRARAAFRVPNRVMGFERLSKNVGRIKLPKVGWVTLRWSRPLHGDIVNATVFREAGRWYVAIQTKKESVPPIPKTEGAFVGLDMGVTQTVTASDSRTFQAPTPNLAKQRKLQRSLSRKVTFSKNWYKALVRLQCHRQHETNRLKDFHHKTSTALVSESQAISLEDLKVVNMTTRARGRGRRAKAGLNRSILAQGWGRFREMLEWKGAAAGCEVKRVDPAYTSQTCAECGVVAKASRKTQASFVCIACGHSDNADVNAARNILRAAGWAVLVCGANVRPPTPTGAVAVAVKQEPTGRQLSLVG